MNQFSKAILDAHLAPGIDDFTSASIPDVLPEFAQARFWIANYFLNASFDGTFVDASLRDLLRSQLVRAQAVFDYYDQARTFTNEFLERRKPGNPGHSGYYRALFAWESCLLNLQIVTDHNRRWQGANVFEKGDNSREERAYRLGNLVKHEPANLPVWLTNAGFVSASVALTFGELADLLRIVGKLADSLQNPKQLLKELKG